MSKCIHDYLSFTFSPEILIRMKSLARTGATIKTPRPIFADKFSAYDPNLNASFVSEISDSLVEAFGSAEFLATAVNYNDAYNDVVHHYGVQLLDSLCCAEITAFIDELNLEMSSPHSSDSRFTVQPRNGGMYGYTHSAMILIDGGNAGVMAWGAENGGCMVSFSGQGCAGLDFKRLHDIVQHVPGFKITRVDIALDDYEGEQFTPFSFRELALDGEFSGRGPRRAYTYIESGHLELLDTTAINKRYGFVPDLGCSFYVGNRESGKIFRAYEKGKQMKSDQFPNWQRAEVEIRSKNRKIPLDVLLNPDAYFAGSYPALAGLVDKVTPTKIKTFAHTYDVIRQRVIEAAATHAGRLINYLIKIENLNPADVCHRLTSHLDFYDMPRRLKIPINYDLLTNGTIEPAF